jgi:hypothetical protein
VQVDEAELVISRGGKPVGVLIGLESEGDKSHIAWNMIPRFLKRVELRGTRREVQGSRYGLAAVVSPAFPQ